jgi:site-specific recombinase XerD
MFARWAEKTASIKTAQVITPVVIGNYQIYLYETYRKGIGGKIAVGTQGQILAPLKSFFRWLFTRSVLPTDPASELQLPIKPKSLPRDVVSTKEVAMVLRRVLKSDHPQRLRDAAIISLAFTCGARKMELTRLQVKDIDLVKREVRIEKAKNRHGRITFFTPWAAMLLEAHIKKERLTPDHALFPTKRVLGKQGCPMLVADVVRKAFACIKNKNVTCHSLRHGFCTSLLRGGANVRVIAELAGHIRLATTARYTRMTLPDLRKIHEHCME